MAVTEVFSDEAVSGAIRDRAGYQAMLVAIRSHAVDVVMAEALDRLSRDEVETISLRRLCGFHRVKLFTLADGEVTKMTANLKGLFSSAQLDELSAKTSRGLEGRVLKGRGVGSPPYGYRLVRRLDPDGEPERGLWEVDEGRAAVVLRIFEATDSGQTALQIARDLNAEGVPGPAGGPWYETSIRGRPTRQDGVLRNATYNGVVVWRRRERLKDPDTGNSTRRYVDEADIVRKDRPDLKIIDDQLWATVQEKLAASAAPQQRVGGREVTAFWEKRRPKHLLSGKVFCGCCGRGMKSIGKDYLACDAAKHGGCPNRKPVRRARLDAQVMSALGRQLMQPELVAACIAAFNAELKQLTARMAATGEKARRELKAIHNKIAHLVDAISDGRQSPTIMAKLTELEELKATLAAQAAATLDTPVALHPAIADVYRQRVNALTDALAQPENRDALDAARALIDRVIVYPPQTDGDPPGIEVIGELIELLKAAGIGVSDNDQALSHDANAALTLFASLVKEGPGARPLAGFGAEPRSSLPYSS